MKSVALVAVPAGLVTVIFPVLAPSGTVTVMDVAFNTVKLVAVIPLNVIAVTPVKFVPVSVTTCPIRLFKGVKEASVGCRKITKSDALIPVPKELVTMIFPVVAPGGMVTVSDVGLTTVKIVAAIPLNVIAVVPVKFNPVRVTSCPLAPPFGVALVIVGAGITVKFVTRVNVARGVVMTIGPVVAP